MMVLNYTRRYGSSILCVAVCVFAATLAGAGVARAQGAGTPRPATPRAAATSGAGFERLAKLADEARTGDRITDAISFYQQALKLRPSWGEGWWYLATLLYDGDRYAEALEAFRRLVPIKPKNGPTYAMMGLCEFQLRQYELALSDLRNSRILGLGDNEQLVAVARYHTGILLTRFEEYELGFEALREFARTGNESPSIIEAMGLNALHMPFLPSEMPADKRDAVLLAGRAAYAMAARQPVEGHKRFEELVARYPDTPYAHYAFGVFLLLESPESAIDEFRKELRIQPNEVPAMLQIAFEYLKRGDFASALPYAKQAVALEPKFYAARNAYGRALLDGGDVPGAVAQLEEGTKLAPDSPEMHFALARAYTRAGRKADAARERTEFLRLDRLQLASRSGPQAVGGAKVKTDPPPP